MSEQISHLEENQELEAASVMLDDVAKGTCHKARWQLESALYTNYDVRKRKRSGIKESDDWQTEFCRFLDNENNRGFAHFHYLASQGSTSEQEEQEQHGEIDENLRNKAGYVQ